MKHRLRVVTWNVRKSAGEVANPKGKAIRDYIVGRLRPDLVVLTEHGFGRPSWLDASEAVLLQNRGKGEGGVLVWATYGTLARRPIIESMPTLLDFVWTTPELGSLRCLAAYVIASVPPQDTPGRAPRRPSLAKALGIARDTLDSLGGGLAEPPDLVVGDLNMSEALSVDLARASRRMRESLDALGLRSAWHVTKDEAFGSESQITYTHFKTHIDYCFVRKSLQIDDCSIHEVSNLFTHIPNSAPLDHFPVVCDLRIGCTISEGEPQNQTSNR